jgi:phenylalanine-4-hydroxylase
MFEEASLYSPVVTVPDGGAVVELRHDHPGSLDEEYRARRNTIASLALAWTPGEPVPEAAYTEQEHEVWQVVQSELVVKHQRLACRAAVEGGEMLHLPTDRIPQLHEVSAALAPLTGFSYLPAAGLVPLRQFYGALADRTFWSTQYMRHHSVPFYTPEPDVVHEVVGHATTLAHPQYADLYEAAGRAARRVESAEALEFVSKVFWFSLEFGVVHEPDGPKAYGAGLLSSYGEIEEFVHADLRPLDLAAMGTTRYDITHYQPVLFAAASWAEVLDVVGGFFQDADDERIAALSVAGAHPVG